MVVTALLLLLFYNLCLIEEKDFIHVGFTSKIWLYVSVWINVIITSLTQIRMFIRLIISDNLYQKLLKNLTSVQTILLIFTTCHINEKRLKFVLLNLITVTTVDFISNWRIMKFLAITLIQYGGFKEKDIKRLVLLKMMITYLLIQLRIFKMQNIITTDIVIPT